VVGPLPPVDWRHPGLAPWREVGARVLARVQAGATVAEALNAEAPPVRFVPQAALPVGQGYERFIAARGEVPTRDNLHDLFNGLVWLAQPALKARLNALHLQGLAVPVAAGTRGPLRDALTLFDEFGAVLRAPAALRQALEARDWDSAFRGLTDEWAHTQLLIVGHALLEALATRPRKGLTAHAWAGDPLAADAATWAAKPWHPLPVHGVPGWWAAGPQDAAFYADAGVFRPGKPCRPAGPGVVGP
jgi:hypothetical protein